MHEAEHPNWCSEQPRGIGCRGRREGVRMDGTHAYLPVSMADHIDVWEKPSQYCNYPPINIHKFKNKIDLKDKGKKTTMRYHLTPIKTVIIKKSTNNKCWRGYGEKGTLLHC